jgi:hypothetical protein
LDVAHGDRRRFGCPNFSVGETAGEVELLGTFGIPGSLWSLVVANSLLKNARLDTVSILREVASQGLREAA